MDDLRDPHAIKAWIAAQVGADDLIGGRIPGFQVVAKGMAHRAPPIALLSAPTRISIDPLQHRDLGHMLKHATHHTRFVHRLATAVLNDAIVAKELVIAEFSARNLHSHFAETGKPPAAVIFPAWLKQHQDRALSSLRVPCGFTNALDHEFVLIDEVGTATYSFGEGGAKSEGPDLLVYLPGHVYREGEDRSRVTRVKVENMASFTVPTNGWLQF